MVQDLWMQPGDRKAEETEKRKVPIPEPLPPVRPTDRRALPLRLEQLGRALPVPVLALIPEDAQDFGAPYGKTVAEFLSKILGPSEGCPHKWRRGVLLITTADWFTSCLPVPSDIID
ncbi:MAG: hypothetical protein FJX77_08575 [Armatimonadetes bacterium]|nr:hypothetical protein [Armatimonadota bacterium]